MTSGSASLFDVVAIAAVVVVVAVVILVLLMRRAAAYPYRAVDVLLSDAEGELLAALRQALAGDYEVYPKVRLANVIDLRKGLTRKQRREALEHIAARHVGFVVCERATHVIRGVVELEAGAGHRVGRHAPVPFLDAALAAARVPLLRIPVQPSYVTGELRERVLDALRPGEALAKPSNLWVGGYFGPAVDDPLREGRVVGRFGRRAERAARGDGPRPSGAWLPTRGVLAIAALLLIVGAVLSWFLEPGARAPVAGSAATVAPAPEPVPAQPAPPPAPTPSPPPAESSKTPVVPPQIIGYRDVRVPGKPLSECMGPDREIGPEVLRCRDGYVTREPIYR